MNDGISTALMSDKVFMHFSEYIEQECGIKIPISKRTMLQARLQKRLRKLGIKSFEEYFDYVFKAESGLKEHRKMIDVVTTNKTDFFREPKHFDYLTNIALPELISKYGIGIKRRLMVWSAGCSTGEEPYTLAMILNEFSQKQINFNFSILATDISNIVISKAKKGIYEFEKVYHVPEILKKKYILKSKDQSKRLIRISHEIRSYVQFERINFMDSDWGIRDNMDIIFCRNVIIYFDRATQEELLNRLCRQLSQEGYLFMGHSETLSGMNLPMKQVAPTVYKKN